MLPPRVPSDSSQKKILKAFKKIGFEIMPARLGKGSHRLVKDRKTGQVITVQYHLNRGIIKEYCKAVDQLEYDVNEFIGYL